MLARISYKWRVLTVVVIGMFMVVLDTTVLNVALPTILNTFGTGLDRGQLVISMYLLSLALVIPTTGYLCDRLGTKRLFIMSMTGFTLGSALCGMAWDINSLILFRVVQGLAGGITMPLGMALIFRTVPREDQGFTLSLAVIPMLLAPMLGPILSGYLVETVGWRWIFFVNVPVGLIGVLLASRLLIETERIKSLSFDYKGFILAGVGFCTALLALTRVPQDGWTAANVVGLFGVSAVALVAWVIVELREKTPLLDLRIFRNGTYTQAASLYFIAATILILGLFLLPLFLQNLRGMTPIQIGILLIPEAVAMTVALPLVGRLYDKFGPRPLLIPGFIGLAYTMFKLHNIDLTTSDGELIKILVLRGLSLELIFLPAFTLTLSEFGPAQLARASAMTQVLRQLFPAFGTAAVVTILQSRNVFHFSTLAQTVTPDSLAAVQVMSRLKEAAGQFGASDVLTNQAAVQILDGLVQRQAAVKAFNDVFLVIAVLALVALIPAVFLRRPEERKESGTTRSEPAPEPAD